MRSALHQQLRALEKQKAKLESQIGSGEHESEALQEVTKAPAAHQRSTSELETLMQARDQWRSLQVSRLDSELHRLRGNSHLHRARAMTGTH